MWSSLTATRRGGRGEVVVCDEAPSGEVPAMSMSFALYQRASYTVPKLPFPSLPTSRKQLLSMRVLHKSSGRGGANAASSNAVAATVFEREGTSSVSCRNIAGLGGVSAAARGATGVELARALDRASNELVQLACMALGLLNRIGRHRRRADRHTVAVRWTRRGRAHAGRKRVEDFGPLGELHRNPRPQFIGLLEACWPACGELRRKQHGFFRC